MPPPGVDAVGAAQLREKPKSNSAVMPAKAGIQNIDRLDPGFRRGDVLKMFIGIFPS